MKKLFITACLLVAIGSATAQSFAEGTKVAQIGVGLGGDLGMPLGASFE